MTRSPLIPASLMLAALMALPAAALDSLEYYDAKSGKIVIADITLVTKETLEDFKARGRVRGRRKTLTLRSRHIVSFRRGNREDVNQWSKLLARGYTLLAADRLLTKGNDAGAEEIFKKITYSDERGTPGQEKSEAIRPWHNMYALRYLIETQYRVGKRGKTGRLDMALENVEQFMKRAAAKSKKIKWQVPFKDGKQEKKIHAWGSSRLEPEVLLFRARILREQGKKVEAGAAYDAVIKLLKDKKLSPITLATARVEKTALDAAGKSLEQQEKEYREAGVWLRGEAGRQPDPFGEDRLRRAANRILLEGADMLFASAEKGDGVSFDVPRDRYKQLRETEGRKDPALYMGAQTGYGICLYKNEKGEAAYRALLEVAVGGYESPAYFEKALYYLGLAAPLFGKELDRSGGNGDFLRQAGKRWHQDLQERFPGGEWAGKVKGK